MRCSRPNDVVIDPSRGGAGLGLWLVFKAASGRPVLIVASGVNRVDEKKIAAVIGQKISRADADYVRDRTGYAIAAYRIVEEGWDADTAIQEMFDFHFNRIYVRNPAFLQRLSERRADIRARLERSP